MSRNNEPLIRDFLKRNGVRDPRKIAEICRGFDLTKPVYQRLVEPGDRLFQFLRNEDVSRPVSQTGNWFCLAGATMDGLAIFSGLAGRRLQEFAVQYPVLGLEGTAASLPRAWGWAGGGGGGATQIYLPPQALFALVGVGTHLPA
ncbi:MAG: hypothetical protein MUF48_01320 [Pirellulaceae bacterium]|jgi:hypothetical protein|nr:hypothetical protein [Pirellulaceae bacterium]